jgi:hypothetical protein
MVIKMYISLSIESPDFVAWARFKVDTKIAVAD